MKRNFIRSLVLLMLTGTLLSCHHGHTEPDPTGADSTAVDDTAEVDSTLFTEPEDEGLSLESHTTEVFGDFMFAFTHNSRFQAERVRFPLPVTEMDGTERSLRSGRQFRSEFHLPGNEFYTLTLGERSQMAILQNDTTVNDVTLQCLHLRHQNMVCYHFHRNDGRWYLTRTSHEPISPKLSSFFQFYDRFTTDSVFQEACVAEQLKFAMEDPDEDEADIEGTIDRDQWAVFRPEMPGEEFVNIDFGQDYPDPNHILFLQCGISDGMMNIFTFRHNGDQWQLTEYEN